MDRMRHAATAAHDALGAPAAVPDALLEPTAATRHRFAGHLPETPTRAAAAVWVAAYVLLTLVFATVGRIVTSSWWPRGWSHSDGGPNRWFAAHRTGSWNGWSSSGSHLSETLTVIVVFAVVATVLGLRHRWRELGFLALALALELSVFVSTTFLVRRHRPPVHHLDASPPTSSFPSGHTAAAVVLYVGIAIIVHDSTRRTLWRGITAIAAVVVPCIVAVARLYRGMHYPSDVVAGALLGAACVLVALVTTRIVVMRVREAGTPPVPDTIHEARSRA